MDNQTQGQEPASVDPQAGQPVAATAPAATAHAQAATPASIATSATAAPASAPAAPAPVSAAQAPAAAPPSPAAGQVFDANYVTSLRNEAADFRVKHRDAATALETAGKERDALAAQVRSLSLQAAIGTAETRVADPEVALKLIDQTKLKFNDQGQPSILSAFDGHHRRICRPLPAALRLAVRTLTPG